MSTVLCRKTLVALQKKKVFAKDMAKTLYDAGYSESKIRKFFKSVAEFLKKISSFIKSMFDTEIITQIDNKVFDINVTVKKHIGTSDGYFYTLYLYENKNTKASPAVTNISGMKVARNASTNSIPEKIDLSIENDKKYLSAVKSGDMATAQAMVEQAARDSGYTYKMYHGAKKGKNFTVMI